MRALPFKDLRQALSSSSDWASLRRSWEESEQLLGLLAEKLPTSLVSQVVQIRRSDPSKGLRGSQLTVVTHTAAAAAKLRLALADWPPELRARGWGIQSLTVTAQRIQDIRPAGQKAPPRAPIPEGAKAGLGQLSSEVSSEALRKALSRISKRR